MPDVIVGCVGGGSNFGGLVFPFLRAGADAADRRRRAGRLPDAHARRLLLRLRRHRGDDAADADVHARPRLRAAARARRRAALPRRRADGLRARQGAGRIEARAYKQNETFEAAVRFARSEGIIPAPEPAHAIRAVIEEASDGEEKTILFGLCGHGHFDLAAYDAYLAGRLEDPEFSEADLEAGAGRAAGGAGDRVSRGGRADSGWSRREGGRDEHASASRPPRGSTPRARRRPATTAKRSASRPGPRTTGPRRRTRTSRRGEPEPSAMPVTPRSAP